jgi:hypothetical protein
MPREHAASVTEVHPAPPDEIFPLISDCERGLTWRPGLTAVERLAPVDGRARWREEGEWGPIVYEELESSPPTRYVAGVADASQGFGGKWTYELQPVDDDRTRLTIREDGFIDSPIFRFLAAHAFGYETTMREVHEALRAHLASRRR